jgi:hypothetical protein
VIDDAARKLRYAALGPVLDERGPEDDSVRDNLIFWSTASLKSARVNVGPLIAQPCFRCPSHESVTNT